MTPQENLIDAVANHLLRNNDQTKEKLLVAWQAAKENREMMDAVIKQTNAEIESGTAITPIVLSSDEEIEEFVNKDTTNGVIIREFLKDKLHGRI